MVAVPVDVVESNGCEEDGEVDVEEVRAPGSRLMLRHTRHDRNVLLGIGRVQ